MQYSWTTTSTFDTISPYWFRVLMSLNIVPEDSSVQTSSFDLFFQRGPAN